MILSPLILAKSGNPGAAKKNLYLLGKDWIPASAGMSGIRDRPLPRLRLPLDRRDVERPDATEPQNLNLDGAVDPIAIQ